MQNEYYSSVFNRLGDEKKNFVLDCLSEGEGVIPYEKIKSYEGLDAEPEGGFFGKTEFLVCSKSK